MPPVQQPFNEFVDEADVPVDIEQARSLDADAEAGQTAAVALSFPAAAEDDRSTATKEGATDDSPEIPKYSNADALTKQKGASNKVAPAEVVESKSSTNEKVEEKNGYPNYEPSDAESFMTRREADEALRLAMEATRAADQALQRALLATRGSSKLGPGTSPMTPSRRFSRSTSSVSERKDDDEIVFTGRPFGGLWGDLKKRGRVYLSDWVDGFVKPVKTLSATTLLYFACLAPAIAFGALLEKFTHGDMGAIECMISTFLCGTANAILAGQPLLILGGTGPVAIFESIMYKLSTETLGAPFMLVRFWTGIWVATILAVCAIFDLCFLIKYITRFTDEIFAALISAIFIYEAIKGLTHPLSISYDTIQGLDTMKDAEHDSASITSLLLGLGTFLCLLLLRNIRKSKFLLPQIRTLLADFSPIIAIGLMTWIDYQMHDTATAKLRVPNTLVPSKDCREWAVPLLEYGPEYDVRHVREFAQQSSTIFNPVNCTFAYKDEPSVWYPISEGPKRALQPWIPFITMGPALLASVLLYLDQNITARLINKADNRLKKGGAYHLDMLVLAGLIFLSSILGLPWMCAATVRSINHLFALSEKEEVILKDGTRKEQIAQVQETRLTGFMIHFLIGLSLLAVRWLKYVPMAVLLGLFLTMGITSLTSIQLWERVQLLVTEPRMYPSTSYVRQVKMWKLHLFTIVQIFLLGSLFVVKKSPIAMLFPLFIVLLVPVRYYVLPKIFTARDLRYLDSEEDLDDEDADDMVTAIK